MRIEEGAGEAALPWTFARTRRSYEVENGGVPARKIANGPGKTDSSRSTRFAPVCHEHS